ncbi:LysR family transcriptional regulator [Roseomonas elaeocarpi]|uniref:LysR substrate-binding domain-containing protein n=1 Tax=Roseomonas elaeocarpi TaxID=907779 RepID=A0ABV6JSX2_9PROT
MAVSNRFGAFHTFVTVCEQGSFTAAAHKLGASASTVTKTIARLEDELGVRLFNRTTRRVALTEQGQALFERAQGILRDVADVENLMARATEAAQGTVRIVVPNLFGRQTLVPALPDFLERYPQLHLQVHFSDRPVDLIEAGFDLAVRTGELEDSGAMRRQLTRGPMITAAAPSYLARRGTPRVPEDLLSHNCIHGRFGPDWSFRTPQGGRQRLRVSGNLALYNGDCLREAAVQGIGIVHSSWWAVHHELERGTLVPILQAFEVEGPPVAVIHPAGRHLPVRVRAVIDWLVEITAPASPPAATTRQGA